MLRKEQLKRRKGANLCHFRDDVKLNKLLRSKRGVNDVVIMWTIAFLFIMLGVLLPYVTSAFNDTTTTINTDDLSSGIDDETDLTSVTALTLVKSVAGMFFWTFGALPVWLDAILLVFRVTLGLLIYRQVRSGGG